MVNLGNGIHDATGHLVWTACFLWLAALQTNEVALPSCSSSSSSSSSSSPTTTTTVRILELGSGTGLGGLALLRHVPQNTIDEQPPCHVTLTDADPEALDLCRRNAILNGVKACTTVRPLTWGTSIDDVPIELRGTMDVVLAADILYDIRMVPAIRQTALTCCKPHTGVFYLAHVPRACFTSKTTATTTLQSVDGSLEDYIIQEMTKSSESDVADDDDENEVSFSLVRIIRPLDLLSSGWQPPPKSSSSINFINDTSLQEMQDVGAALFVFQKKKK
eukprot:scaffold3400_cov169-Amphora_coffeaeformis.AAC.1